MNEFKNDIKLYIKCDNVVKTFNEKATAMREQRESYSNRIMKFMTEHNMNGTKLELPMFNSTLKMSKHTQLSPLNYNFLLNTFTKYFGDKEQAQDLLNYIKESRSKDIKYTLSRNVLK